MTKWFGFLLVFFLSSCLVEDAKEGATDTQKIVALRGVTLRYVSLSVNLKLPGEPPWTKSFSDLRKTDPTTFNNLSNYTISLALQMTADNSNKDAQDAKFDGIDINLLLDTLDHQPVALISPAFDLPKGEKVAVSSSGTINLATHKQVGKYIFQQMADGADLDTRLIPTLKYKISQLEGSFTIDTLSQKVPTEKTLFLKDVLNSGLLD